MGSGTGEPRTHEIGLRRRGGTAVRRGRMACRKEFGDRLRRSPLRASSRSPLASHWASRAGSSAIGRFERDVTSPGRLREPNTMPGLVFVIDCP